MINKAQIAKVKELLDRLIVFRTLKSDPIIQELIKLETPTEPEHTFHGWYGKLLEKHPEADNCWSIHLNEVIEYDENYFSLQCEAGKFRNIPEKILEAAKADLRVLLTLLKWDPVSCLSTPMAPDLLADLSAQAMETDQLAIRSYMEHLAAQYHKHGTGVFGKYSSFCWSHSTQTFKPVTSPDPITFDDLIGYDYQKQVLQQNTRQFLKGLPANNILLYGDRGTGKSSSVKALGNMFAADGLRIVEVNKEDLTDFPTIIERLHGRGLKFILYIDDLSFENGETQYKHLKTVLEGGLEVKPSNVLIYATSNRRHLIKENFSDRDDEVHGNDTVQEKLSLADRFGISLTFTTPDQKEYLAIVLGLAKQRRLGIPNEELAIKAIQWERYHNGRSGRTAKQFIDQLQGELEEKKK